MHGEAITGVYTKFGYQYFGPMLLDWYNRMIRARGARDADTIYCLGREGWNLVSFFSAIEGLRARPHRRYVYLHTSRALLTHLALDEPEIAGVGFSSVYAGSLRHFFEARLGISLELLGLSGVADQRIHLPRDLDFVSGLFAEKSGPAKALARASREAYGNYLRARSLEGSDRFVLTDLGFRGTSQALLSKLYGLNLTGIYAMLDPKGVPAPLELPEATTVGLFSDDRSFGEGYEPMERSLLLEAFLTAPFGQVVGIRSCVSGDPFLYRPAGRAQANFGIIADCMQGALKFAYDHEDLVGSDVPIIADFQLFFEGYTDALRRNLGAFEPVLELDDSYFGAPIFSAGSKL
jgi:hypothetical protein